MGPARSVLPSFAVALAAALSACVSAGDHELLKKELTGTRTRLEKERDAARTDSFERQKVIDRQKAELAVMAKKLEDHTATMMERDRRIAERLQQLPQEKERVRLMVEQLDALEEALMREKSVSQLADERAAGLEKALAALRDEFGKAQTRVTALEAELAGEQAAAAALRTQVATLTRERDELQRQTEDMQAALADLLKRKQEADARIAEFRNLVSRFQKLIDAGKLRVKIVDGRMIVELATDVLFSSGSAALSRDGKAAIAEVAGILATIPDRKFQVEGHTDNVPIRTEQYPSNWELAAARSLTVVKTMLDNGMPGDRISAASFGDSRPALANDSPEGKRGNRRIEIVLVPDLSSLPGFDELNKAAAGRL